MILPPVVHLMQFICCSACVTCSILCRTTRALQTRVNLLESIQSYMHTHTHALFKSVYCFICVYCFTQIILKSFNSIMLRGNLFFQYCYCLIQMLQNLIKQCGGGCWRGLIDIDQTGEVLLTSYIQGSYGLVRGLWFMFVEESFTHCIVALLLVLDFPYCFHYLLTFIICSCHFCTDLHRFA